MCQDVGKISRHIGGSVGESRVDAVEAKVATLLTFDELAEVAREKAERATAGRESWDKLIHVIEQLKSAFSAGEGWISSDSAWSLVGVSVLGFRGIQNSKPLDVQFSQEPGVTVLHGLNGAGKSSFSDAVMLALAGEGLLEKPKGGGAAPLWSPVRLAKGVQRAALALTLVDAGTGNRLAISCTLGAHGTIERRVGILTESGGSAREVDLDGAWREYVLGHSPVFAYAELERRVQTSKDLANYFETLLALGPSFAALDAEIVKARAGAELAKQAWTEARDQALAAIERVDQARQRANPGLTVHAVLVPDLVAEPDSWLSASGLNQIGTVFDRSIPESILSDIRGIADKAENSIVRARDSGDIASQQMNQALAELLVQAGELEEISPQCPACSSNADWFHQLAQNVQLNEALASVARERQTCVEALVSAVRDELAPALLAARAIQLSFEQKEYLRRLTKSADVFQSWSHSAEPGARLRAFEAAEELCQRLRETESESFFTAVIVQTEAALQWKIERALAAADFEKLWRLQGAEACEVGTWKVVAGRLSDLRDVLRARRSDALRESTDQRVNQMLGDSHFSVDSLTVKTTKATLVLRDASGESVELGMLSAGQRNAVLLAPMLASMNSGPFGFLILDDPVHAFDDLRIDRLSHAVASLASERRVVVLTHDARLREHLAARSANYESRLVERNPVNGHVRVASSQSSWNQLLDDAHHALVLGLEEADLLGGVTNLVRASCRMSLDAALREFVVRNSLVTGQDYRTEQIRLDKAPTTAARLAVARSMWSGSGGARNPFDRVESECKPYFDGWNNAAHGKTALGDFAVAEEIKAARTACKEITKLHAHSGQTS
ncbi:AAA family ATPase [Pseudoclavibacter sp. RFBA6]|uniref:AAA family ATPase n=1 Tax=Pseudoclavibacter sp. RFBA6 TaxID=2080573 RepID=UPI000CE75B34|nr:AAA family ATPase [Pseudoclavibacter sp. RFBA6]PPG40007.1 hypothetical protein C5C17_09085 [Pseudoclavibacter sp. RFBA6]